MNGPGRRNGGGGAPADDNDSNTSDTELYDDSMRSWMSEPQSLIINWRGWKRSVCPTISGFNSSNNSGADLLDVTEQRVLPLVELAAQSVARHFPFEVVETVNPPVPEQLHLRIAFWSFPDNEEDIRLYACLANGSPDLFNRAEDLLRKKAIKDMLQIGFHLSASVLIDSGAANFEVSLTFDRKKIVTCNCTCAQSSWCAHVIAVCLQRIGRPNEVTLRAPISESLSRLHRDQLQKFAQYLISELPKQILPTAQKLLDDLLDSQQSRINSLRGAPDPTAGASINEHTAWFLDASVLHENIRKILLKLCIPSPIVCSDVNNLSSNTPTAAAEWQALMRPLRGKEPEGIWNLMAIIREMMKRGDCNAVPLLRIVTQEIMDCSQIINWWFQVKSSLNDTSSIVPSNGRGLLQNSLAASQHACASLCEEIVVLWRLACLNPLLDQLERDQYFELLKSWHIKVLDTSNRGDRNRNFYDRYVGFKPALEACFIDWSNYPMFGMSLRNRTAKLIHDVGKLEEMQDHHLIAFKLDQQFTTDGNSLVEKTTVDLAALSLNRIQDDFKAIHVAAEAAPDLNVTADDVALLDNSDAGQDRQLSALYKFKATPDTNLKLLCQSANNELTYSITLSKTNDLVDIDFARAEALYAHGMTDQACKMSVLLAEHLLRNPPKMNFDLDQLAMIKVKKSKVKLNASLRQPSLSMSTLYTKIIFLCTVLGENPASYDLAFQIGLFGLELARSPAPMKSLEVKLFNQEQDLYLLLKKIPLESKQMSLLRQKAIQLRDGSLPSRGALLPLMLSSYIFDALVLSMVDPQRCTMRVQDRLATDEALAFSAAIVAVGMKCIIPEVDYPLLCEGIRCQKADLIITLLVHYKNDERRLVKIMQKLLDRSFYSKSNPCGMNCIGPCICQPFYPCPNCNKPNNVAGVSLDGHLNSVQAFPRSSELSSLVNANVVSIEMAPQSHHYNYQCDSPALSNHCLYSSVDSHSLDPYHQWNHAQPIEKRNRAFGYETNGPSNDLFEAPARNLNENPRFNEGNELEANLDHGERAGDAESKALAEGGASEPLSELHQLVHCLSCPCVLQESRDLDTIPLTSIGTYAAIDSNMSKNSNGNHSSGMNNKNRYKEPRNKAGVNSEQTLRAMSHYVFELAKIVLAKAGGSNCTVELFRQPSMSGDEHVQTNKQLHMCAFQLAIYALGLFNSYNTNWCIRTYSQYVCWISTQALEIGYPAFNFLLNTWRGHLTPTELVRLAGRASCADSRQISGTAARLSLSGLLHAFALNAPEIKLAMIQLKDQGDRTFIRALEFVECSARQDGIQYEILFEMAHQWSDLADIVKVKALKRKDEENKKRKKRNSDLAASSPHPSTLPQPMPIAASANNSINSNMTGSTSTSGNTGHASLVANNSLVLPSPVMIGMYMNRAPYSPAAFAGLPSNATVNPIGLVGAAPAASGLGVATSQMQSPLLPTPPVSNASALPSVYGNVRSPPSSSRQPVQMPFWPWGNNPPAAVLSSPATGASVTPANLSGAPRNYSLNGTYPPAVDWITSVGPSSLNSPAGPPGVAHSPMLPTTGSPVSPINAYSSVAPLPISNVQLHPGPYFNSPTNGPIMMSNSHYSPASSVVSGGTFSSVAHLPTHSPHVPPPNTNYAGTSNLNHHHHHLHSHHHHHDHHNNHHHHSHGTPVVSNPSPVDMRQVPASLQQVFASALSHPLASTACADQRVSTRHLDAHQALLIKAYQIGLMAMDKLCKRVQEEKPHLRFARLPPYGEDVKWLFSISKKLGFEFVHEFCRYACVCIQSPFVLHEIIDLACDVLRSQFQLPDIQVYASPVLKPLIHKCQHMYFAYLYYQVHSINSNDYERICHGIVHAKIIFNMEPNGEKRFIELLTCMKRHYSNRRSIWEAVHDFFPANDIINTDSHFRIA